jgi:hypothetical protein
MPHLPWISDKDLQTHVNVLLEATKLAKLKANKKLHKNVIDPFSAIFQMSGFSMNYKDWIKSEEARQSQKTMQNFVGKFHQDILGSCNGWQNLNTGTNVELVNQSSRVIAEVKNKHNTISGGDLSDLYYRLHKLVMPNASGYKGFTSYHVAIIPKKPTPYNIPFTPSDRNTSTKCPTNALIRMIDGASFYAMATGHPTALIDLFNVLPRVIGSFNSQQTADIVHLKSLFKIAYG